MEPKGIIEALQEGRQTDAQISALEKEILNKKWEKRHIMYSIIDWIQELFFYFTQIEDIIYTKQLQLLESLENVPIGSYLDMKDGNLQVFIKNYPEELTSYFIYGIDKEQYQELKKLLDIYEFIDLVRDYTIDNNLDFIGGITDDNMEYPEYVFGDHKYFIEVYRDIKYNQVAVTNLPLFLQIELEAKIAAKKK